MNVNSYVIRGPEGAVVVDGQLCRDDGERVRQAVAAPACRWPASF